MREEKWFAWKVLAQTGAQEWRLVDPHISDHTCSRLFKNRDDAFQELENLRVREEAHEKGWVLCSVMIQALEFAPPVSRTLEEISDQFAGE